MSVSWWNGFDFVGIDATFGQSFLSGLSVGLAGLDLVASVVSLLFGFYSAELFARAWRKGERLHDDVGGPSDLLGRQQFATDNIFTRRRLLTNRHTEQMAMNAAPAAALEMVQRAVARWQSLCKD